MVHKTKTEWVEMGKSGVVRVVITVEYDDMSDYMEAVDNLKDEAMSYGRVIDTKTLVERHVI